MKITVTDRDGRDHALDALPGWSVMEVIRDHAGRDESLAIKAECGGAMACATCHVYVDAAWAGRLPARGEEEEEMLDGAFDVRDNSRLSCQLLMNEGLDGLKVALAPGSEP